MSDAPRDGNKYINDDFPLMVPLQNKESIEALPDYYELYERRERSGYSSQGKPQQKWVYYAIRPLTGKELGALEEGQGTVLKDVTDT